MAGNRVISAVLTLKDKNFGTTAQKSASAMKNLERETKHSANTVKNFGKSATSSFKSVATGAASIIAAIGVTKALSSAFNMVRSSVSSAFERIDTMEQFERTMTSLTGSTDKAKAALESTRDAVTGTAYGLDNAAKSVQGFVTRGMDIEKATDTVATWGDAVAFYGDGSNEQLESVSEALANMYSTGKVSMDQVNRLYGAGISAPEMYAQATGRNVGDVKKDLSSGKISAESFIDTVSEAMMEGTNGVEKIAGAAKEAGGSWRNTFGNMRAAVTRGVEGIIVKIDDMLESNGLPNMREMVANFGKTFENFLKSASDKIPQVTEFLVGMYEKAQPGITWMTDTGFPAVRDGIGFAVDKAKEMYDFIVNNWSLIGPVIAGVTAAVGVFKAGIVAITAVKATWAAVTAGVQLATALLNGTLAVSPLGWVALAIGAVVAAGILLWQNWDTIKAKAVELWETVNERFPWIQSIVDTAMGGIRSMIDGVKGAWESFKTAISNFKIPEWVGKAASILGGGVGGAVKSVGNFISGSHASGLNRVPHDGYIAELHKDEMVIPATQSRALRKQGVNINNISEDVPLSAQANTATQYSYQTTNVTNSDLPQLIQALLSLVEVMKNGSGGDVYVQIDGHNKSVTEIVDEMIPMLKLRLANM